MCGPHVIKKLSVHMGSTHEGDSIYERDSGWFFGNAGDEDEGDVSG